MKQRSLLLRLHNESSLESVATNSFDMICPDRSTGQTQLLPTVAKATPIVDCANMEIDVQTSSEHEDDGSSALTDDIADDWSLGDCDDASTDFYEVHVLPLTAHESPTSLYSFYFEDAHAAMAEDDAYLTFEDDVSFGGADSLLEGNNEHTGTMWSACPPMEITHERLLPPAQVSLSSVDFGELQRVITI